jgi:hypothetical protein
VDLSDRIKLGYERFNRREWEAIAAGLPDDFEAVDHLDERRARGSDALQRITNANADMAFADMKMEPMETLVRPARGESVDVLVRVQTTATGEASGMPLTDEVGQIWTFERGVPVRFEQFRTWEDAERAAGAD